MKKLIIGILIMEIVATTYASATEIIKHKIDGNKEYFQVRCSNGNSVAFNKDVGKQIYYSGSKIVYSYEQAVKEACNYLVNSEKKYIYIKYGGIVFSNLKDIKKALTDNDFLTVVKLRAARGTDSIYMVKKVKVKIIKSYKIKGKKYYKIYDGSEYGYVRASDIL